MREAPDRVKGLYAPAVAGTVADGRRRLLRLSQNVQPERQHAAKPDGVVGVIGVGIAT
jgi:hypothetical protein